PEFPWKIYFSAIAFQPTTEMNIAVPTNVQAINSLIKDTSLPAWKSYLRWELVRVSTPALPRSFRDADFAFYGRQLNGVKEQPSRAKQCTDLPNRDLGAEE